MGNRESVKLCRDLDTWHPNDLMNMSNRYFRKEERVNIQSEKLNIDPWRSNIMVEEMKPRKFVPEGGVFNKHIASSSPARMSSDTLYPQARPSEEISTSFPDKKLTRQRSNVSSATKRGMRAGKKASKKSGEAGPTAPGPTSPKPGPTKPSDVLAGKTKKKKKKKKKKKNKNKMVGPTKPEEINTISKNELYEASGSSSRTDSFSSSEKKTRKNRMCGWKQEWNSGEEIAGLDVDEKSESETPIEEYQFYTENDVAVTSYRFYKYPRTAMIPSRRHKYSDDGE